MSDTTITHLVDRGLAIRAQIKQLTDELKVITEQLQAIALEGEQIPLEEADRPGKQYLAAGTGVIVPVVFESDQLVGTLPIEGDQTQAIVAAVPVAADLDPGARQAAQRDLFHGFFRPKYERVFEDSLRFRREAFSRFGPQGGARFIDACIARGKDGIPRSRTLIAWDRARAGA